MNGITINGQRIPWTAVQSIRSVLGNSWDLTIDALWKARKAKNVIAYVKAGLKPDVKNHRYSIAPSAEMEHGRAHWESIVQAWWDNEIYKKPKPVSSMKENVRAMLMEMAREL